MRLLLLFLLITAVSVASGCYLMNKHVECKNTGNAKKVCKLGNTRKWLKIWIVEQYTENPCIKEKTFGLMTDNMWTTSKCQGRFQVISCKWHVQQKCRSYGHDYTLCKVPTAVQVLWVRVLTIGSYTPCAPDQYGINGDSIWVDQGCNGMFDICFETSGSMPTNLR